MLKEYDAIARNVCNLNSVERANPAEKQGAIGVACVLAYLRGTNSTIEEMSKTTGIPSEDVEVPFQRLLINGVFSSHFNIKEDSVLLGNAENSVIGSGVERVVFSGAERTRNAWCQVAGISSGLTGLR